MGKTPNKTCVSEIIGLRAFARLPEVNVSVSAIQRAIVAGRITAVIQTPRGRKLLKAQALNQWHATRIPQNNNRWGELDGDESGNPDEPNNWAECYTKERTLLAREQRKKVCLEREELEGKLHRDEDVEAVWVDMLVRFRTRILAIPAKAAPTICAIQKIQPAKVQSAVEALVREALTELADYPGPK